MAKFTPTLYAADVEQHACWLRATSRNLELQFRNLFADNPSSAVMEMAARKLLLEDGVEVAPGGRNAPDYSCRVRDARFLVEVSSLGVDTVSRDLGIPQEPTEPVCHSTFAALVRESTLMEERKRRQLERVREPLLLVIGSPHFMSSSTQVDSLQVEWTFCEAGHSSSLFDERYANTRAPLVPRSVSAILFFASGAEAVRRNGSSLVTRGVLCPDAKLPFRTEWLPLRDFCEEYGVDPRGDPVCRWFRGNPRRQVPRPR